jgi:hypothetical protein
VDEQHAKLGERLRARVDGMGHPDLAGAFAADTTTGWLHGVVWEVVEASDTAVEWKQACLHASGVFCRTSDTSFGESASRVYRLTTPISTFTEGRKRESHWTLSGS